VVFNGLSRSGKADYAPLLAFKNSFIRKLSADLPSVSVICLGVEDWQAMHFLSDAASRGLPVMVLDTRDRGQQTQAPDHGETAAAAALSTHIKSSCLRG
jgi:hypothetical protein